MARSACMVTAATWYMISLQNLCFYEIMRNASLMQQGNFIDVFLARHVSGAYAHHQEH